jgi:VIT1/CCC1 family predicted Fe2+/Mn2+ transporter
VELYRGLLAELRLLVHRNPKLVLGQLTDKLVEAGFANDTARRVATELPLDEQRFLDFSARIVFGLDPDELGSPITAALSSLALFTAGAAVPLLPWFITDGGAAVAASVIATALASMTVGGWVSRSAGKPLTLGAARQLLIVVATSTVTYCIGRVFGTAIA